MLPYNILYLVIACRIQTDKGKYPHRFHFLRYLAEEKKARILDVLG